MATRYLSTDEFLAMFPDAPTRQILGATKADPSVLNTASLISAIEKAEAEADAYIQVQYVLPLKSVPVVVKQFVGDIARYRLYFQRATPEIDKLYADAVSFFKQVAARKNMLGVAHAETEVAVSTTAPRVQRARRPSELNGF